MKCGMTLCVCGKTVHYDEHGYIESHDHADQLCDGSGKNIDRDAVPIDAAPKRVPVDFRYDAVNPTFLKWMARIGGYASEKYGSWDQYKTSRLTGDKSPINHIYEHLRSYVESEPYDHFDGDVRWHLVAVAYNAMMAFYYHSKWGPEVHPLHLDKEWKAP